MNVACRRRKRTVVRAPNEARGLAAVTFTACVGRARRERANNAVMAEASDVVV